MKNISNQTIGGLIRDREDKYAAGSPTQLSEHVDFNLKDHVNHVEAYKYSKHLSSSTDSQGREKPFFQIGTAASNVWYRATDLDRRNIRVKATKEQDMVLAFAATQKLQEFMRKADFGTYLNKWGRALADYGSAISKFVEKDGELHAMVIPWNRVIVDSVSFDDDVVIEILELTPDKLLQRKGYDQTKVKELLDALENRENTDKQDKDQKTNFIKLYEVHGMMPKSFRTGDEKDNMEFEQQMYVVSFVKGKDGQFEDYVLASGRESVHPYVIDHLIEEEGRVCSIGAYEHLFEAQWMTNHTALQIKTQLDLASKIFFQTADDTFAGQNATNALMTGDIFVHADGKPLGEVPNHSHDVSALQSYGQQWEVLAKELTSTPDAIRGDTMPSGTAYRSVAIQNRESHSLFELMTENKGLAIERMMRKFILPYIKRQIKNNDEIAATLESAGLKFIDPRFIRYETQKRAKAGVKDILVKGKFNELPNVDEQSVSREIESELAELGNTRFLKPSEIDSETWADVLDGLEWELEVEVTNENTDKEAMFATYATVLQTIASLNGQPPSEEFRIVLNKILEETGKLSPLELPFRSTANTPSVSTEQLQQLTPAPAT